MRTAFAIGHRPSMVQIERAMRETETALLDMNEDCNARTIWKYGEAKRELMTLIERRGA